MTGAHESMSESGSHWYDTQESFSFSTRPRTDLLYKREPRWRSRALSEPLAFATCCNRASLQNTLALQNDSRPPRPPLVGLTLRTFRQARRSARTFASTSPDSALRSGTSCEDGSVTDKRATQPNSASTTIADEARPFITFAIA